jgi:hypothetical protein
MPTTFAHIVVGIAHPTGSDKGAVFLQCTPEAVFVVFGADLDAAEAA